jgi:hypothetical protein
MKSQRHIGRTLDSVDANLAVSLRRRRNSPSLAWATPITPQNGLSGTTAGASDVLTSASSVQ